MSVRDKARATKLRRVSEAAFDLEADRRGFVKMNSRVVPFPLRTMLELESELRSRGMHMIEEPAHAVNDLATVRAMIRAAEWMKTFRELHENTLAKRNGGAK